MNSQQELLGLEDRLLALEFKQLKKLHGQTRTLITQKKSGQKIGLEIRVSNKSGAKKFELRTATGWQVLSADRSNWPQEAREMQAIVDEYDKRRTVNGRLLSVCDDPVALV